MLGRAWLRWRGCVHGGGQSRRGRAWGTLKLVFVVEVESPFLKGGAGGTFRGFGVGGEGRKSNWYEGQLGGLSSVSLAERRCIQSQIEYTGR